MLADCTGAISNVAYVLAPWPLGDIHLCLPWLRTAARNERGESFIHELHHWDPLRGQIDLGDYHGNEWEEDTVWPIAVNTPDAFSELVQDLYENT